MMQRTPDWHLDWNEVETWVAEAKVLLRHEWVQSHPQSLEYKYAERVIALSEEVKLEQNERLRSARERLREARP